MKAMLHKFFSWILAIFFSLVDVWDEYPDLIFLSLYLPPRVQPLVEDHLVYRCISWWKAMCPSGLFLEGPFHLCDCSSAEPCLSLQKCQRFALPAAVQPVCCPRLLATVLELFQFLFLKSPQYCFQHSMCSINVYCLEMSRKELVVDLGDGWMLI